MYVTTVNLLYSIYLNKKNNNHFRNHNGYYNKSRYKIN